MASYGMSVARRNADRSADRSSARRVFFCFRWEKRWLDREGIDSHQLHLIPKHSARYSPANPAAVVHCIRDSWRRRRRASLPRTAGVKASGRRARHLCPKSLFADLSVVLDAAAGLGVCLTTVHNMMYFHIMGMTSAVKHIFPANNAGRTVGASGGVAASSPILDCRQILVAAVVSRGMCKSLISLVQDDRGSRVEMTVVFATAPYKQFCSTGWTDVSRYPQRSEASEDRQIAGSRRWPQGRSGRNAGY